ncbi:uncharacterized protein LOC119076626 [Bradysia coprophila]|uniref:uncharacterized protein LOC119076626 n=1 Tax=Bradysia coprophila TaxID=38358 RepID=UPI00187D9059|nr:uncharacterized protein LOC119076626 [Bradysia coprophila]
MFNHSIILDEDTIRVRNGHCVMDAIASQNNQITEDELFDQFITSTDASRDIIEDELRQILHNGMVGGFIVKTGNKYAIPTLQNTYATDCDDGEGDDSKDDVREGDGKQYAITISSPDRSEVTVKVEPGTSPSRASRKRAATGPSPHEPCLKRGRDAPCPEAVELSIKLRDGDYKFEKSKRMEKYIPKLFSIDEKSDVKRFARRPTFVEGRHCAPDYDIVDEEEEDEEEAEEDESGPGFEEKHGDDHDDDDPSACKTGPATRKSTRKIIPAKGKCGGRADPHKCSF